MNIFKIEKSKNWEERGRILSRRLYYAEFALLVVSLVATVFLSFDLFSDAGFFRRTLILLFGIGGISSFHFLFQRIWELWAELHDRFDSSFLDAEFDSVEEGALPVLSTIKVIFSSENEEYRKKHLGFLREKIEKLSKAPCEIIEAKSALETLSYVTDHVVHLVILDSHYQNELCLNWAEKIKQVDKNIPVIVCSPFEKQQCAYIDGWFSYLQREADIEKLLPYFLARETINGTRTAKS